MLKLPLLRSLQLALFLCLWAANAPAQESVMMPPPLPGFATAPPPDPDTLPPPPPLEWEPLAPLGPEQGPSTVPAPPALLAPLPPAPALPPPPAPVIALFVGTGPDPAQFELATPRFEVWRSGAEAPEIPTQVKDGLHHTLITSGEPIVVRLLFDPSLTGTALSVTPDKGVLIEPAQGIHIGPSGECLFTVDLEGNQEEGQISFYSMQITTVLRLTTATPETIELLANP
ncbi:MAG TPA: hypothetical protein VNP98_08415 [Chthoniobacterales bacterium]|nr:hypothetical protein [Chthoniobacterales bacterium]